MLCALCNFSYAYCIGKLGYYLGAGEGCLPQQFLH
jgi:hypothetical protein